jgi:hypothetical protein
VLRALAATMSRSGLAGAGDLDELDWATIYADFWANSPEDRERKNRKQAEILVHGSMPVSLCHEIVVVSPAAKARVEALPQRPGSHIPTVVVRPQWYC